MVQSIKNMQFFQKHQTEENFTPLSMLPNICANTLAIFSN
jgi:hypothetical protein